MPNEKATDQNIDKVCEEDSRNLNIVLWSLSNKTDKDETDHLCVGDNTKDVNPERVENQMEVKAK